MEFFCNFEIIIICFFALGCAVQHSPSVQIVTVLPVTFGGGGALSLPLGCLAFGSALPGQWCLYICSAVTVDWFGLGGTFKTILCHGRRAGPKEGNLDIAGDLVSVTAEVSSDV